MTKYFTLADIFLDVTVTARGDVYIWRMEYPNLLDDENYQDTKKYHTVRQLFIPVMGNSLCYWIGGSYLDDFPHGTAKVEKAKRFAAWYHRNRDRLRVIDLNG